MDVALSLAQTATAEGCRTNRPIADTLAWAYYKKGAYQAAIDLLEEANKKLLKTAIFSIILVCLQECKR